MNPLEMESTTDKPSHRKRNARKRNKSSSGGKTISEVTHTDFLEFIEPFWEPIDDRKYTSLEEKEEEECLNPAKAETYSRYADILRDRLCASFVVDDTVELEEVSFQGKELKPESACALLHFLFFAKILFLKTTSTPISRD